jgi:hypothetical protein
VSYRTILRCVRLPRPICGLAQTCRCVSQRGDVSSASSTDQDGADSNSASSPIDDMLAPNRTVTGSDMSSGSGSEALSPERSGGSSNASPAGDTLSPGSGNGSEASILRVDDELALRRSKSDARANMIPILQRSKDKVISAIQNKTEIWSPIFDAESGVNVWIVNKAELAELSRGASSGDTCFVIDDGTGKNSIAFVGPPARIVHRLRPTEKRKGTPDPLTWEDLREGEERQVGWDRTEEEKEEDDFV